MLSLFHLGGSVTTPEFPAEQPVGAPANLADWGTRAIGLVIDALPMLVLGVLVFFGGILRALVGLAGFFYFYIYLGSMDGNTGQTPGKMVMGTRVVNAQGETVGSGNGIARKFCHIIDGAVCLIGWFLPIFDVNRQTIADKIMTTYVVTGAEKKPFAVDLYLPKS
jgi:uncharacterized RDD family membrane protein YckC